MNQLTADFNQTPVLQNPFWTVDTNRVSKKAKIALGILKGSPTAIIEKPKLATGTGTEGSILNQDLSDSEKILAQKCLDTRLFSLIHADLLIKGTSLEGDSPRRTSSFLMVYLYYYLDRYPQDNLNGKIDSFILLLEEICFVGDEDPQKVMRKVYDLKEGQSVLVASGWAGKPDHVILIKFSRHENYDIEIFNTGAGAEFHFGSKDNRKLRSYPSLTLKNISAEELCLTSDFKKSYEAFFEKLASFYDINKHLSAITPLKFYQDLFGHVEHKKTLPDNIQSGFITGQRSGTCPLKVFEAWLRFELQDVETYKRFILRFKFDTTRFFYYREKTKLDEINPLAEEVRILLKEAVKTQMRMLVKFLHPTQPFHKKIEDKERQIVRSTLQDLKLRLESIEEQIQTTTKTAETRLKWIKPSATILYDPSFLEHMGFSLKGRLLTPKQSTCYELQLPQTLTSNVVDELKQFSSELQKIFSASTYDPLAHAYLVEKLSSLLHLHNEIWNGLSRDDLLNCIVYFYSFLKGYVSNPTVGSLARHQNCALKFFAFVHHLCLRMEEKMGSFHCLKEYSIYIHGIEQETKDPHLLFDHPHELEERQEILAYFDDHNRRTKNFNQLFNYKNYVVYESNAKKIPEVDLYLKIIESDTYLRSQFQCAIAEYQQEPYFP